jgi:predicted transcriptional regulator
MNKMTELIVTDFSEYEKIAQALSNKSRLKIINLLKSGDYNINEMAKALQMPVPTVTVNVQKLTQSGLVDFITASGKHGTQKICSLKYDRIIFSITDDLPPAKHKADTIDSLMKLDIPLSTFINPSIHAPCGLADGIKILSTEDDEASFFNKYEKISLIWFGEGRISFPLEVDLAMMESADFMEISFEGCSQHLFFDKNWASDITLWINGCEVETITTEIEDTKSNGKNTPDWWPKNKSQHGEILTWKIEKNSPAYQCMLNLPPGTAHEFTFGIKSDASNSRGLMIFGNDFGSHSQDIVVELFKNNK